MSAQEFIEFADAAGDVDALGDFFRKLWKTEPFTQLWQKHEDYRTYNSFDSLPANLRKEITDRLYEQYPGLSKVGEEKRMGIIRKAASKSIKNRRDKDKKNRAAERAGKSEPAPIESQETNKGKNAESETGNERHNIRAVWGV
ncbi:hypothetical protein RUND412_003404 [Rhizina undulata]